ncbi:M48 family metalloprotease [Maribellus comscasis]|uniref:M48 family metalloprotease n=1 Tax=Maribellus comscasis TaxID=2681766 RepID=A0A6I6JTZ2_9BACT|nr:M48 family metalloprotease [Maribellus comscasis]QGY43647.1 M48 family metalloprotease [Maribellus comscasis]
MKKRQVLSKLALLIAAILLIPSCAVNPVTGKKQLMLMTEEQEIELGAQYDPTVIATFGLYENPDLQTFIEKKGTELAKISHRPNLEYHFRILDSPVINAFAVPGGYIYMTRGILAHFNNEAELIGVLGHEMGHITARHTASQQSKQQLGQLLLVGGMIVSEDFRQFADYAMQGMQLLFLKFSRDNERQSDKLGVEYSTKIGYDAHKMADFFHVLDKMQMESESGGIPTFYSTHPDPGDRYNDVNQRATSWQDSLNSNNWTVNEDNYLRMIDGIVYGEDPRQGYVESGIFYHPEMKFKFPVPSGWQLENSPLQVQMAPSDGKAAVIFTLAKQKTAAEAAQTVVQELNLTTLESRNVTVNGLPTVVISSQQVSQNEQTGAEQTIKVLSYFIEYSGSVYVFHGVSSGENFSNYLQTFELTMSNFNRLTEASKLNVKPKRIKIQSVRNSGTLADALKAFGVSQNQMNELALLNNMELTEQVSRGKLIKLIGD